MMKNNTHYDLKQQTLLYTIGIAVQYFSQWLISVLLVRMDSFATAGVFSLAITVSNIFAYFGNYGMRSYQVTDVNNKCSDRQYLLARGITVGLSLLFCVLYLSVAKDYNSLEKQSILLYLGYNCVNTISDVLLGSLQVRGHLDYNGFANIIRGFTCFVAFMVVFTTTKSVILALIAMIGATTLVLLLYEIPIYRKLVNCKQSSSDLAKSLQLIRVCSSLALSNILPIITMAIPRRTVQRIMGISYLGVFSSIFTPTLIISLIVPIVITAVLPSIAAVWERKDIGHFQSIIWKGLIGLIGIVVFSYIIVWLWGKPILRLLFGESIITYFPLLYYAIFATGLNGMVSYLNGLLTAIRRMPIIGIASGIALMITLAISNLFVEKYFMFGAVFVLVIAYAVQSIILLSALLLYISAEGDKV